MPLSPTTITDLKTTTAHFDFLLSVPNIKIKHIPPAQRLCVICQEPFSSTPWYPGTTVNRPVKLACGHVFGIQCLAHLVFTSDFSNRCPLCRAPLMPASFARNPSAQSWRAAVPLLRLAMMFGKDLAVVFSKDKALEVLQNGLEREGLRLTGPAAAGKHMHRLMILYEEFLTQFCVHPQPTTTTTTTGDADRLAGAEERVRELLDMMSETQEARRRLDEARELRAQQEESAARSERERELNDVKRGLEEAEKQAKETREELLRCRKALERAENEGLEAKEEVAGAKKELEDATRRRRCEETLEGLEETEKKIDAVVSSAWVFLDVGMAVAVVLVHFEAYLFETSSTTSMFVAGLWLVRCIVAVFRSRSSRLSWITTIGLIVFGVFLGIAASSRKETIYAMGGSV
ncbi:MAG: hypothetical protein ALECFALPRED_003428 [Alectoria fallacina]|uniref:RING-type domain-containing protein n=1 Tax=Alectoria fallacina TaxID=1903189 RepID=A0A8H3FJP5_9LECA|nr:MAG: hypothetical protein ALECFALPRED_003428 [Alectoria fallacina]